MNNNGVSGSHGESKGARRAGGGPGGGDFPTGEGGSATGRWGQDAAEVSMSAAGPHEAEEDPLPLDILPGNKQPLAIDRRVEDLLRLLRPAPRAEAYRRSVFTFVTRQVGSARQLCLETTVRSTVFPCVEMYC